MKSAGVIAQGASLIRGRVAEIISEWPPTIGNHRHPSMDSRCSLSMPASPGLRFWLAGALENRTEIGTQRADQPVLLFGTACSAWP